MKTIPMLFNTNMVKALLDGRKSVTRRPVKISFESGMRGPVVRGKDGSIAVLSMAPIAGLCPFGNVGDLIWVRETFAALGHDDYKEVSPRNRTEIQEFRYKASERETIANEKDWEVRGYHWRSSIHMPRHASRLTLKVTGVRIEKVQSITPEQALKEGVIHKSMNCPVAEFGQLWNSLYGSWFDNPYVWVVEFEVMKMNVDSAQIQLKFAKEI